MTPVLHVSGKKLWQLYMLEQKLSDRGPEHDPVPAIGFGEGTKITKRFPRSFASLEAVFCFAREFFERHDVDERHHNSVCFALEEIFTNLVKYGGGEAEIEISLDRTSDRMIVRLTDFDVEPWDVTQAPDVDTTLPLEQRQPGGLGLHLTRKLLDGVDYEYEDRRSSIILTKRLE
jgi:serine/threonine-protein kinase RsbW